MKQHYYSSNAPEGVSGQSSQVPCVFQYAMPVFNGVAVASSKDWDDYELWSRAFAARGWQETKQRVVSEYGLEFRAQEQRSGHSR